MKAWIKPKDLARASGILVLCFMLTCGGLLASIRSGWASTKPFIQNLASQGVISQAKADLAIRDVDDILVAGTVAEQCVNSITSSGNEKKIAKARCYFTFAQSFRVILQRHNIGGSAQLDKIALIGESFIVALEEYFRRATAKPGEVSAQDVSDPDKTLESEIKRQREELKAITGK